MKEAATLLVSDTSRTIKDIASEVGYESPPSFFRAFNGHFKMTPGDYRKLNSLNDD